MKHVVPYQLSVLVKEDDVLNGGGSQRRAVVHCYYLKLR